MVRLSVMLPAILVLVPLVVPAYAQVTIDVNSTTVCFLNDTAGLDIWRNCGFTEDYIQGALLPWEWMTGGYFSIILISIFILFTYIKYHKVVYPIMIGILFLPVSYFFFPVQFVNFAIILASIAVCIIIWHIFIRQTKEYS